ncbi:phage virion morphogenesis protein [Pseudoduganella sp. FT55W]|uniref:Phage virion morphogenesis protein n=1 Tax=Duganella rivi TaxID=2666083 RepID=A0A7X4GWQ8_9BURK|nr:phage virion morphogenesis protein [Duganella rivi]MYM70531.1 phage virion morphogenesis protein [Duganella rivi]
MDDLTAIEEWAGGLLAQLQPGQRRAVATDIARKLRRSQQSRIKDQLNPDGSKYEPRKQKLRGKSGRIKRKAMFAKLRTVKYLKIDSDANGLAVGFAGRVAALARVHQEGETSPLRPGGPRYKYPVRQLLGFTASEREMIQDTILAHLTL